VASNLNRVVILGYLASEIDISEIKTQSERKQVAARFQILCPGETYSGKQKAICFFEVQCYGQLAVTCDRLLKRGAQLLIDGKLRQRRWEGRDGIKRNSVWIEAQTIQFLTLEKRQKTPPHNRAPAPTENAEYQDPDYVEKDF
jgi:single-strand DNA-binding protein